MLFCSVAEKNLRGKTEFFLSLLCPEGEEQPQSSETPDFEIVSDKMVHNKRILHAFIPIFPLNSKFTIFFFNNCYFETQRE